MDLYNSKNLNELTDDGFVKTSDTWPTEKTVTTKVGKKDEGIIDAVIKFGKNTANMVVDESKTLVPAVADTFRKSSDRLNTEKRLIPAIPNSYLYWGLVGVTVYILAKNV